MLYLLEENTSYVVLFSSGLGLIIEFWKLTQAMSISLDTSRGYPRLRFADKSSYSCVAPSRSAPALDGCCPETLQPQSQAKAEPETLGRYVKYRQ